MGRRSAPRRHRRRPTIDRAADHTQQPPYSAVMAPTHAAVGLALGATAIVLAPGHAATAALWGVLGGLFPDIDLFYGQHRRTLHFPVYYWFLGLPALALATVFPTAGTIALAAFLCSAAVHSGMDAFGAGDELRPWEATSEKGVYDHLRNTWIRPRRWVRYDGAPEDLFLTTVFAIPGLTLYGGTARAVTIAGLILAACYALVRKHVPKYFPERFQ